jgi:hypothetical protein
MAKSLRTLKTALNKASIELDRAHRAVFAIVDFRTDVRFCDIIAANPNHILVEDYNNALTSVDELRRELREAA